ncbi:hypothetical protein JCM1840_007428 [Sporobolomyces johnsonii]
MASVALSNTISAVDKLDWNNGAPTPIPSSTSIQPFDNMGFTVPHDILVLVSSAHHVYIPLSYLCHPAILDFKSCKRSSLLDVNGKLDAPTLKLYLNLEDIMDFATWSQAMTMMHLSLDQVMGPHQICARLSEDSWPVLRCYDIDMRKHFWEEYQKAEAAVGQDGNVAFQMPKSAFGKCLDIVTTTLKPSTFSSVAMTTSHTVRGHKVSVALTMVISITEKLKLSAYEDAVARLQSSSCILPGSAAYTPAAFPPSPTLVATSPSPTPSDSHHLNLVRQQVALICQLQQQDLMLHAP